MSDQYIVEKCSPTLAGLKTGNLFTIPFTDRDTVNGEIRALNRVLVRKGLRAVPVRYTDRFVLIYLYRPDYLKRDLEQKDAAAILRKLGYTPGSTNRCVCELEKHLNGSGDFPHEIGLFLGYPPEDVLGFMRSPHAGFKCVGYWKVYGDEKKARRTFRQYRKCTEVYRSQLERGRTLFQLIV